MGLRFAVAWYRPGDWRALRRVAVDPDELETSYDLWQRLWARSCADLEADGLQVERIAVDADELIRWCSEQQLPVDAQARARFTSHKLHATKR